MHVVPCVQIVYILLCKRYEYSFVYMFHAQFHVYTFCTQFHVLQAAPSAVKLRVQQSGIFKERRLWTYDESVRSYSNLQCVNSLINVQSSL